MTAVLATLALPASMLEIPDSLVDRLKAREAALIAEAFTPRLRYGGASLGYQLASIVAGGPAPLIATALFAAFHTGYAIAIYIAVCAIVSIIATMMMPDHTNKDISAENA